LTVVRELVAYHRMCWIFDKAGGLTEGLVDMPLLVETVVEILGWGVDKPIPFVIMFKLLQPRS